MVGVALSRDDLPRDEKLLIDRLSYKPADARRALNAARLRVSISAEAAGTRNGQIALLVATATAARSFRGGVHVAVPLGIQMAVRWRPAASLEDAVTDLGGLLQPWADVLPTVTIGTIQDNAHAIGVLLDGGAAGCAPASKQPRFDLQGYAAGAVFGASVAVHEAFRQVLLHEQDAGSDEIVAELLDDECPLPHDFDLLLPGDLTFLGCGHLGQAAMFAASLLGPRDDTRRYVLHDKETAVGANPSTQLLTRATDRGKMKTAVCAAFLRARGIECAQRNLPFGPTSVREANDPKILMAGLDDGEIRRSLECAGYKFIVDSGIGGSDVTYASFKIHTFPASRSADSTFRQSSPIDERRRSVERANRYATFEEARADECGARDAAGASVGVPFIGTAVAALSITEILLNASNGKVSEIVVGDLRSSEPISAKA